MSNNGKRVAWVTGGGSGIGESGAEFLAVMAGLWWFPAAERKSSTA